VETRLPLAVPSRSARSAILAAAAFSAALCRSRSFSASACCRRSASTVAFMVRSISCLNPAMPSRMVRARIIWLPRPHCTDSPPAASARGPRFFIMACCRISWRDRTTCCPNWSAFFLALAYSSTGRASASHRASSCSMNTTSSSAFEESLRPAIAQSSSEGR
jgi:hypothetical protein